MILYMEGNISYAIGIDVGLNSVGLAAIRLDDNGEPIRILKVISVIHDAGIDPNGAKESDTRKAISGVARRVRRLYRQRRRRLQKLDFLLQSLGWPVVENKDLEFSNSFIPWIFRAKLADEYIEDEEQRKQMLSVAIRHIARHRGWRNPYQSIKSMMQETEYSEFYNELLKNIEKLAPGVGCEGSTPAQLVRDYLLSQQGKASRRLRITTDKKRKDHPNSLDPVLPRKLMQSDSMLEILNIFNVQHIDDKYVREQIINAVFYAKSPRGSAENRVGKDAITGKGKRALKASLAFQKYRIISTISNLRIRENSKERCLTIEEKQNVYKLLTTSIDKSSKKKSAEAPLYTWIDVADCLGIERYKLRGVGSQIGDGESVGNRPPMLNSELAIIYANNKSLRQSLLTWWLDANRTQEDKEALIGILSNTVDIEAIHDNPEYQDKYGSAIAFIDSMDETEIAALENISLPNGRAAYSLETLDKLNKQMLETDDDLFKARKKLFNLPNNWRPSEAPIAEPTGNPSVDRVLKIVHRFLISAKNRWGNPERINIEHVRSGFQSKKMANSYKELLDKRTKGKENLKAMMRNSLHLGTSDSISDADIRRYEAVQRQNGQCLYCGSEITYHTCELDHIVPRKGPGSTNTRENLVATCSSCNAQKCNTPFATWCEQSTYCKNHDISVDSAINRVRAFIFPPNSYDKRGASQFKKEVISRLKQKVGDEAFDNRSIESVAWMANELHRRIDWYYNSQNYQTNNGISDISNKAQTNVGVYAGSLTAIARRMSGIDGKLEFFDGRRKTRFDRRHHAVDASVIAMMTPGIAQILAIKCNLRETQLLQGNKVIPDGIDWKEYPTANDQGYQQYANWSVRMNTLLKLLNEEMRADRIAVVNSIRLRYSNSSVHKYEVHALLKLHVGDEIDSKTIRRASTPALYCALTRNPDYDVNNGLPENPDRTILLHNKKLNADDSITFFEAQAAQLFVREGSVEIGNSIHHLRIYEYFKKLKSGKVQKSYGMIRVFQNDLHKYIHEDLFSCDLPEQTISMRYADTEVAHAVQAGNANYLGYLVPGDEIIVDFSHAKLSGYIGDFVEFLNKIGADCTAYKHWVVVGTDKETTLILKPSMISSEGIDKLYSNCKRNNFDYASYEKSINEILAGKGWRVSVNVLAKYNVATIRRNALGEVRWTSRSHLPISWRWDTGENRE